MSLYKSIKEKAWEANMQLPASGLVVHTFGNVSAFEERHGCFAIKPSGVPYKMLKPEDMIIVDLEGKIVSGKLRPSSDTKTHCVLYKNFPGINGICHTHSTYAVAWAQAMRPIPILGTTHADHLATDVPCTEVMTDQSIRGDYEEETGKQILQVFKKLSYNEVEMVLVAGHGPFTWGASAEKAVYNSIVLEELAKMAILTLQVSPGSTRLKDTLIEKHYDRKHGSNAYYGQK
jgi:L-ribulose-5-phosphate 4-epimerase